MNEIITIEKKNVLQVFTEPESLNPILDRIASEARSFVPDATEREQRRVAAEAKAAADAQAKRDADIQHKKQINRSILSALVALGVSESAGKDAIVAIASGKISNIKITY